MSHIVVTALVLSVYTAVLSYGALYQSFMDSRGVAQCQLLLVGVLGLASAFLDHLIHTSWSMDLLLGGCIPLGIIVVMFVGAKVQSVLWHRRHHDTSTV